MRSCNPGARLTAGNYWRTTRKPSRRIKITILHRFEVFLHASDLGSSYVAYSTRSVKMIRVMMIADGGDLQIWMSAG